MLLSFAHLRSGFALVFALLRFAIIYALGPGRLDQLPAAHGFMYGHMYARARGLTFMGQALRGHYTC